MSLIWIDISRVSGPLNSHRPSTASKGPYAGGFPMQCLKQFNHFLIEIWINVSRGALSARGPWAVAYPVALCLVVWSHVYRPALVWLRAWRWWTAADCSDSLAALIVSSAPHNGPTRGGGGTLSLFTVRLLVVLIGCSLWLLCRPSSGGDSALSS